MKDFLRKDNTDGKKRKKIDQVRNEGSITQNPE